MAAPAAPSNPQNKPSGNPYPRRGQIKAKIVRDLISIVASIRGRRMPSAAAPPPEQLPIPAV